MNKITAFLLAVTTIGTSCHKSISPEIVIDPYMYDFEGKWVSSSQSEYLDGAILPWQDLATKDTFSVYENRRYSLTLHSFNKAEKDTGIFFYNERMSKFNLIPNRDAKDTIVLAIGRNSDTLVTIRFNAAIKPTAIKYLKLK